MASKEKDALTTPLFDAESGEPLEQETIDLLADVEGDAAVAAAKASLDANLPSVASAWNAAVSD